MKGWSLRARLVALVLGAAVVTGAVGAAALWSNQRVAESMRVLQEHRLAALVRLDAVGRRLEQQRAAVLATLAATNDVMVEDLKKRAERDGREIPASLAVLRSGAGEPEERAAAEALGTAFARSYDHGLKEVLTRLDRGQFVEADVASQSLYRPELDAATRALDAAIEVQTRLAAREYERAAFFVHWQAIVTLVATLLAFVVGIGLARVIAAWLKRVLGANELTLAEAASEFAAGRVHHRIEIARADSASVAHSLNRMGEEFSTVLSEVAVAADRVAAGSGALSSSSRDLSSRANSQASSLEQSAASMQELAATVRQNAERAARARSLAADAARTAHAGRNAAAAATKSMRDVADASSRITEIASVIDAIAFQTNILALNAAVEAARAGEHGRGFAVVAAEVRALSQRSAEAAREIGGLIGGSVERIAQGSALVEQADKSIAGIVEQTEECARVVADIATASTEQSAGIQQLNGALDHLESVTQDNASEAERTAHQAREMSALAEELAASLARFGGSGRLEGDPVDQGLDRPRVDAFERQAGKTLDAAADLRERIAEGRTLRIGAT